MMSCRLSSPPVADLHSRKPDYPMLITPGSKANFNSNCLALAWPSSKTSDAAEPEVYYGGDDNGWSPIAERSKTHAGLAVSPSGKPLLKIQSSYQGYFAFGEYDSSTPINRNSAFGHNRHGNSPNVPSWDTRHNERTSSFISFNTSPQSSRNAKGWKKAEDSLSWPDQHPHQQEDKRVRFRNEANSAWTNDRFGESLPSPERESSYDDMSISSNDTRSHSDLSFHRRTDRRYLHSQYQSRAAALSVSPSGVCQMLCWLLMTIIVILIVLLSIFFMYSDYQKSSMIAAFAPNKQTTLKQYLEEHLIGQDIAVTELSSFFDNFLNSRGLANPVMISFHGGVGVGKSFTNQLIGNYYFSDMSSCISTFSVPLHHSWPLDQIRNELTDWLTVKETSCPFQFHILNDLGSDTPCSVFSLIEESLSEFLSKSSKHKHVIIAETDVAHLRIKQIALEYLETSKLEILNIDHFADPIKRSWEAIDEFQRQKSGSEYNPKVGCHFTDLFKLVHVSIPFMPLERHHVKLCVYDIAQRRHLQVSLNQVEWVADQVVYGPQSWPVFSSSGCKSVLEKLNIVYNSGEV